MTTMTTMEIEYALVEKLRTLPAEKQQEVLDFVDFPGAKSYYPAHNHCQATAHQQ